MIFTQAEKKKRLAVIPFQVIGNVNNEGGKELSGFAISVIGDRYKNQRATPTIRFGQRIFQTRKDHPTKRSAQEDATISSGFDDARANQ